MNAAGDANTIESSLSMTPPCPGRRLPESLTPARRLSRTLTSAASTYGWEAIEPRFDALEIFNGFQIGAPARVDLVLDISRYWEHAVADDPAARLSVNWLPETTTEQADRALADFEQRVNVLAAREGLDREVVISSD